MCVLGFSIPYLIVSRLGSSEEIAKLFPNVFGQPSALLATSDSDSGLPEQKLKIGVVLSGGQAPGEHNVISGIFDYLQDRAKGITMYGFRGGPAGIMKNKYIQLTPEYTYPHRNQIGHMFILDLLAAGAAVDFFSSQALSINIYYATLQAYTRPRITFIDYH